MLRMRDDEDKPVEEDCHSGLATCGERFTATVQHKSVIGHIPLAISERENIQKYSSY